MTPPDDGGDSPQRALLLAIAAMAGVALLVGLAVGGALLTVMNVAGVGSAEGDAGGRETLYIPSHPPTETASPDAGGPSSAAESPKKKNKKRAKAIKLFAAPQAVAPGERINLNGVYAHGEGATLQVQRKEGGHWVDFPVTTTVRGGTFSTWILTSRTGKSPFRVYDKAAGRGSNVVRVTIG